MGIAHHLVGATVPGGRAVPAGTAVALEYIVAVLVIMVAAPVGTVVVLVTTAVALVANTNNERRNLVNVLKNTTVGAIYSACHPIGD